MNHKNYCLAKYATFLLLAVLSILFTFQTAGRAEPAYTTIEEIEPNYYDDWNAIKSMRFVPGDYETGYIAINGTVSYEDSSDAFRLDVTSTYRKIYSVVITCDDNETAVSEPWSVRAYDYDWEPRYQGEWTFSKTGSQELSLTLPSDTYGIVVRYQGSSEDSQGTYTIRVNDCRVPIDCTDIRFENPVYTGEQAEPPVTITFEGNTLKEGEDYTVNYGYGKYTNVGRYSFLVWGSGYGYKGSTTISYRIEPASMDLVTIGSLKSVSYTGEAQTQSAKLTYRGMTLKEGTDYIVSYKNNIKAGTATAVFTGKGNYTGKVSKSFRILPVQLSSANVSGITASLPYTGSAIKQDIKVVWSGKQLIEGTDYTITYKNNQNAGTASVTITFKGNYSGTVTKTFRILPLSISSAEVSDVASSAVYAGKAVTQTPAVHLNGRLLQLGRDYTVTYQSNNQVGTASMLIKGKGNYTGSISRTFKITPGSGILTATAGWYSSADASKVSGKLSEGTGVRLYQKSGNMWRVRINGQYYWVNSHYVFDTATQKPSAADRVGQGVTTKPVIVYSLPSVYSTQLMTLKEGMVRNLYAQSGNWYQIYSKGQYGWVRVDGFDYTQSVSRGRLDQITTAAKLQTYYGPGAYYDKSIVIPAGVPLNIYKREGSWALVYRTGKFLWVRLSSTGA